MPDVMHQALERQADRMGLKSKHRDAYIYGAMENAKKRARAKARKKAKSGDPTTGTGRG